MPFPFGIQYGPGYSGGGVVPAPTPGIAPSPVPEKRGFFQSLFGGPDLSAYAGLLSPEALKAMQGEADKRGRMGLAMGLLSASGVSSQRRGIGDILAAGIGGKMNAQDAYVGQQVPLNFQLEQMRQARAKQDAEAARQEQVRQMVSVGDFAGAAAIDPQFTKQFRDATAAPEGDKPQAFVRPDGSVEWAMPGQNLGPMTKPEDGGAAAKAAQERADALFKKEQDLRREYTGLQPVKDLQSVIGGFNKVASAASNPSPAGDMSLVFGYMKMLDPASSVREGEQAQASQATNVPGSILNTYNKLVNGETLSPQQRQDFVQQAQNLYTAQLQQVQNLDKQYSGLATSYQVNPDLVTPDFSIPEKELKELQDKLKKAGGLQFVGNDPATGLPVYKP